MKLIVYASSSRLFALVIIQANCVTLCMTLQRYRVHVQLWTAHEEPPRYA